MGYPTIYLIRPKSGWDWNDYVDNWIHNWTSDAKKLFKAKGYQVEIVDGCNIGQFRKIISSNSTFGVIIASHGTPFDLGIQVDKKDDPEMGVSLKPADLQNRSPNLKFFGVVACDLSPREINKIRSSLKLDASRVITPPAKYIDERDNIKGFEALDPVIKRTNRILPNILPAVRPAGGVQFNAEPPASPNAGPPQSSLTPGLSDQIKILSASLEEPQDNRKSQQASTTTNLSQMIKVLDVSDNDEQPGIPLQTHLASRLPSLQQKIKILDYSDNDEQPDIPLQSRQAATIPKLSDWINRHDELDDGPNVPLQNRQPTLLSKLSDRITKHDDLDDGPNVPLQNQQFTTVADLADRMNQHDGLDDGPNVPLQNQPWQNQNLFRKQGLGGFQNSGQQFDFGHQQDSITPQWMKYGVSTISQFGDDQMDFGHHQTLSDDSQFMKHGISSSSQIGGPTGFSSQLSSSFTPQWMNQGTSASSQFGHQTGFGPQQAFPNQLRGISHGLG